MLRKLLSTALMIAFALPACSRAQAGQAAQPDPPQAMPPASASAAPPPFVMPKPWEMKRAPPNYDRAPPALREFLLKAKAADAIADPLQRCLAFPTLPDTHWPKNLEVQHCRYMFGPRLGFDDIKLRIDANDVAGLEVILRKLLDRHFSKSDFSEDIHAAMAVVGTSPESDRVTKRWLELSPDSPYALTARAEYLRQKGWVVRGEDYVSKTSAEKLAQMSALHEQAAVLYRKALEKEPRMMPAYSGLVDIGKNGTVDGEGAFEQGFKVDPGCKELVGAQMVALQPRWGGSWEEMEALEKQVQPHLAERPLLALPLSYRHKDMAEVARSDDHPDQELAAAQPAIAESTSPYVLEDAAYGMYGVHSPDTWLALSYLVAASRYRPNFVSDPDTCECEAAVIATAAELRGMLLESNPGDYEAANRNFAIAVKVQPKDAAAHFYYAEDFNRMFKPDEAEREYLLAEHYATEKDQDAQALDHLVGMLTTWEKFDKATAYAQRLVKDYPGYLHGLLTLHHTLHKAGAPIAQQRAPLETYLRVVDRFDPDRGGEIIYAAQALHALSEAPAPAK
jgi:tetratricopeptide (TPR) repeat protein